MTELFSVFLDILLAGLIATALFYAVKLSRQIEILSSSKEEMTNFISEFASTVERAEAGINGLKTAARSSGDDLEQLIDKAQSLRDELQILIATADKIANRLGDVAVSVSRASAVSAKTTESEKSQAFKALSSVSTLTAEEEISSVHSSMSKAEKDLLQAINKRS